MFKIISAILLALPLTLAAPAGAAPELETRASGDITYFHPGLGACGNWNGDNDMIVAVSASLFDSERPCGRRMRVTGERGSVDVTVVDRCTGCAYGDVDLSPAAFKQAVGDLGLGRRKGSWVWI